MWNKTIFEYNQKAADFLKESINSYLELFPDDKDMQAAKEKDVFLGYTCKEDSTKITDKEKEKLNATIEDFIAGWKGWHVWEWERRKHIQVSFPDTHNVPEPVVYGQVELCEGCYDDYYVITTEEGEKFLKARLAEIANIPVDEIEYIQWNSENSDNIEDICNFFIFTTDNKVINYWTYCMGEYMSDSLLLMSEDTLNEWIKERENYVNSDPNTIKENKTEIL